MTVKFDISEATVEEAAKILDQVVPKWYHNIDLSTFNFNSPCKCVAGQLCGNFFDRKEWLKQRGVIDTTGIRGGPFGVSDSVTTDEMGRRWRTEIEQRLAGDPKPVPVPVYHEIGGVYRLDDSAKFYILAQVGARKLTLVSLCGDGNRWHDTEGMVDFGDWKINEAQFKKICGQHGNFTKVQVEIKAKK